MDYDKYYEKKGDGTYLLHFPNSKGLSEIELQKIFHPFGKLLSINTRGQTHGLCFIKYQYLEDVKRCIDALRNHEFIKILPHKNKMTINKTKRESYTHQRSNQSPHTFRNRNHKYLDNNGSSDDKMNNEKYSDTSLNSLGKNTNTDICTNKVSSFNHSRKLKMLQRIASSTSISSDATEKDTQKFENTFDQNEIPLLVCNDEKPTRHNRLHVHSSKIIPAQEVIVANIHPSLGIHYILHLFEKYNPISVSCMITIPKLGIRYCHVYFKTINEALAIEEEFDMCLVRGNNLIVLRSQKLMEEAH